MEGRREEMKVNSEYLRELDVLVEEGDVGTITDIIRELEVVLADMERQGGLPEAMHTLRTRKALAEAARERLWIKGEGQ